MTTTRELLKEAYRLIRRDKPELARDILRPILEDEPENAHAWWLLAYSVDDPHEVREALNKVLEIDPNYTNADKAREMLAALEEQYFAETPVESGSLFDDDADADSLLGDTFGTDDAFGADDTYESYDTSFFDEDESLLGDLNDGALDAESPADEAAELRSALDTDDALDEDSLDDLFSVDDVLTDETTQAETEEKAGRKGGGGRALRFVLFLLLVAVVVIGAWYVFLREDTSAEDPGELTAVETDVTEVGSAIAAAQTQLIAAGLGAEQRALMAETALGSTLFLEFCREPSRTLPEDIATAMGIAVQQAEATPDDIVAVGVSINRCNVDPHDTLYRAFVSVENAQRFTSGEFGSGDEGWSVFQTTWQKP
ncbi:MAG: hypothetical protein K8S97_06970 [Anaerolineae bacterium]|nr:hypothetical protein [Anaerolineae bacterium]